MSTEKDRHSTSLQVVLKATENAMATEGPTYRFPGQQPLGLLGVKEKNKETKNLLSKTDALAHVPSL